MAPIKEIEGIGPAYAEKLKGGGVITTDHLLEQGASAKGRATLAASTGISESLILRWVNHADLARIKGVGWEYADLLEAAGVDTVPELAQRRPENLHAKLGEVNEAKSLVRRLPSLDQVSAWVAEAATLERKITH
ncbi:MAG TPA: DUF4332 domain-containing protein [Kouleothrix sp.]|uniref:DUF4332 domain-containing protein n=1 Tax=Kouleothrix sp. TaxID=2779161 RepID=UPI002D0ED1D9|nr:DUF4332 domain-containing protein [Kouleothrix sp.]HRC74265.1 DUF4332 domain-containing protein [Kouleothrix sp.]